jgi:hypothetical protein
VSFKFGGVDKHFVCFVCLFIYLFCFVLFLSVYICFCLYIKDFFCCYVVDWAQLTS